MKYTIRYFKISGGIMRITIEIIKNLNPCEEGFNKFNNNYPDYDNTLEHFITLDKITYHDKMWVISRLLTREQKTKWLNLCAESTAPYTAESAARYAADSAARYAAKIEQENKNLKFVLEVL